MANDPRKALVDFVATDYFKAQKTVDNLDVNLHPANEGQLNFIGNVTINGMTPSGGAIIEPTITSGVEIAKIDGVSIYAPEKIAGFVVVSELPSTGETDKIYLVGPVEGDLEDKYEEYIYTTEWVKIGDTSVNLEGYAKSDGIYFLPDGEGDVIGNLYVDGLSSTPSIYPIAENPKETLTITVDGESTEYNTKTAASVNIDIPKTTFVESDESYLYINPFEFTACEPNTLIFDDSEVEGNVVQEFSALVNNNNSTERKIAIESTSKSSIRYKEGVEIVEEDFTTKIVVPAETTMIISGIGCTAMGGYIVATAKLI